MLKPSAWTLLALADSEKISCKTKTIIWPSPLQGITVPEDPHMRMKVLPSGNLNACCLYHQSPIVSAHTLTEYLPLA